MIKTGRYTLKEPATLETPAMLVFEHLVDHNIKSLLEFIGGAANVMPHVKTHKMAAVTRKHVDAGITAFKASTLKEAEMVLAAGAQELVLAYPIIQPVKIERLVRLCEAHPEAKVSVAADSQAHLDVLGEVASEHGRKLHVMLDLDVGMHRTGLAPGAEAERIYGAIVEHVHLDPAGLHAYDGHDHHSDPAARKAAAESHIREVEEFRDQLIARGFPVPRVVGGGSYSFPFFARHDGMLGSPGTTALWDAVYSEVMPDLPFVPAALVLTQAVDRHPDQQTVTFDLGIKAVASDPPLEKRARLAGRDDARLVLQSEEHGVFAMNAPLPEPGAYFLAIPGHVCPTTVRYPFSYIVDRDGAVVDRWEHTARDR